MTRKELVDRVREGMDPAISQSQVAEVIERAIAEIGAAIERDGRVSLPGFGTFTVRITNARVGINPMTGETIELAGGATVAFKPSAELRARLTKQHGR